MARFKLGQLGEQQKPTLKFSEWIRTLREQGKKPDGAYPILLIMLPSKYPSGALVFDAGDVKVKLTVKEEVMKEFLKAFKFKKEKDRTGLKLNVVFDGLEYYIEDNTDGIYEYKWQPSWGWKLVEVINEEEEDIEF